MNRRALALLLILLGFALITASAYVLLGLGAALLAAGALFVIYGLVFVNVDEPSGR